MDGRPARDHKQRGGEDLLNVRLLAAGIGRDEIEDGRHVCAKVPGAI